MSEKNLSICNQPQNVQIHSNESSFRPSVDQNAGNSASESAAILVNPYVDEVLVPLSINQSQLYDSSDNILDRLNDDCIINIFEYLPFKDLCSVAEVCRAFESNAISVFKRYFSNLDLSEFIDPLDIERNIDWENTDDDGKSFSVMQSINRTFCHFGEYIQTIDLDSENFDENHVDEILLLMATYCAQKESKLEKLIMCNIDINKGLIVRLQPIFGHLKSLEMIGGTFDNAIYNEHQYLIQGSELTELILEDFDLGKCFMRTFKNLQTVSLIDVSESFTGALASFLTLNPHLLSLTIIETGIRFDENLYSAISSLPKLEALTLRTNRAMLYRYEQEELHNLSRLQHLKVFSFYCASLPIAELWNKFAERNVPIEELEVTDFILDFNVATSLSKCVNIKKLILSVGLVYGGQLSNVVKGMPHLEELYLSYFENITIDDVKETIANAPKLNQFQVDLYFELEKDEYKEEFIVSTEDFNEICRFIADRRNRIKLNLNINGIRCKLNVPATIIELSRSLLNVNIQTYHNVEDIEVIGYYDDGDQSESDTDADYSYTDVDTDTSGLMSNSSDSF